MTGHLVINVIFRIKRLIPNYIYLLLIVFLATTTKSLLSFQAQEEYDIIVILSPAQHQTIDHEFLEDYQANLAENNIHALFISGTSIPENIPSIEFSFFQFDNDTSRSVFIGPAPIRPDQLSPVISWNTQIGLNRSTNDTAMFFALSDLAMGITEYTLGDCDSALDYFDQYARKIEYSPDQSGYRTQASSFYAGNCALLAGDYETAATLYEQNISDTVSVEYDLYGSRNTIVNLAWVLTQLEEKEAAYTWMDRYVQSAINYHEAWSYLNPEQSLIRWIIRPHIQSSHIRVLNFDYELAIADIQNAIEIVEKSNYGQDTMLAELYTELGKASILLYEWDRVLTDYDYAIELDPAYADAYFYRGILYYSVLAREEALSDFEAYLELNPHGEHAGEATRYAESIHKELEALSAP